MNNSNGNTATKPDNSTYFSVLNIISNSNLSQFLGVAKVNDSTYDNAKSTDKTWLLGVENVITAIFWVLQK